MITITIESREIWDEKNRKFLYPKTKTLQLEHSLISISKWESKWHIPFLSRTQDKTTEQVIDYIKCMTLTPNVDPNLYLCLSKENVDEIMSYINDPMTATWFVEQEGKSKNSSEEITNETIYYQMVAFNIPAEYQKWHLNRLLTLIRVCSEKNKPPKKMSPAEIMARNRRMNEIRRKRFNSKG